MKKLILTMLFSAIAFTSANSAAALGYGEHYGFNHSLNNQALALKTPQLSANCGSIC